MHPDTSTPGPRRLVALTALAMLAFATNSLLCRLALQQSSIDPASFGSVRLASGAFVLALIVRARAQPAAPARADWIAASMLWLYVAAFSFAYVTLPAGTGALILFGAVQLTMFAVWLARGERFAVLAWGGFALASTGLVLLVAPGLSAPSPVGAALMAAAGLAWGVYSLRGRDAGEPVAATAGNFVRATPLALVMSAATISSLHLTPAGIAWAVLSGALTSGLGYVLWYAALPRLGALRAATVQLSVPPIAALAGVALLGEAMTWRLSLASAAILGGIALVLLARSRAAPPPR
jgi:drug/metabolite transporter (DMT)-like permease